MKWLTDQSETRRVTPRRPRDADISTEHYKPLQHFLPIILRYSSLSDSSQNKTVKIMADTTAASKSPKRKATKPKAPAVHPKYSEMVKTAISTLKERGGSSRQAILKYIMANFSVGTDPKSVNARVKVALRSGVTTESLKQSKGTGATGSFRLGAPLKVDKPKKAIKPKAVAKPKKPKSPKKVKTPKKAVGEKKTAKPKKVKTPKKKAAAAATKPKKTKTPTKKATAKPKKVKTPKKKAAAKPKKA